jgi:hypothetical protein
MKILYLIPVWFVFGMFVPLVWSVSKAYRRSSGPRLVNCPADSQPATIELDVQHAVAMHVLGNPVRKIQHCSRWPERQACGRNCLTQVAWPA